MPFSHETVLPFDRLFEASDTALSKDIQTLLIGSIRHFTETLNGVLNSGSSIFFLGNGPILSDLACGLRLRGYALTDISLLAAPSLPPQVFEAQLTKHFQDASTQKRTCVFSPEQLGLKHSKIVSTICRVLDIQTLQVGSTQGTAYLPQMLLNENINALPDLILSHIPDLERVLYYCHPSAYVDAGASIGEGTKIWHFSHVQTGARIGKGCNLGQNVNVDRDAVIGDHVKVQNNVSIYKGVIVEDYAFLGPSCVFTNVINPRSHVPRQHAFRETRVGQGASIGANATIICGVTIGNYAFIGAGSVVTRDVSPYALMTGVPARRRAWLCHCGEKLPALLNSDCLELVCQYCASSYQQITRDGESQLLGIELRDGLLPNRPLGGSLGEHKNEEKGP